MILRPYQDRAVSRGVKALKKHKNTLIVAPTGAGKTIMLSALAGRVRPKKALILQHRDELVRQNMSKYVAINTKSRPTLFNAGAKSWQGDAVFAMVQTLSRGNNLGSIPALDLLIVDECHHVAAASYIRIIEKVKKINPGCMVAGFTATPQRADKKGLRTAFDNCADQIAIRELIDLGFLVPPKAFVIDIQGVRDELSQVKKLASDFDPAGVEKVMNKRTIHAEMIRHWKEKAGNRQTIVFCSTIQHADDVRAAFLATGVKAETVTGDDPIGARRKLLSRFHKNDFQVLVNVGVLVEGFDEPSVGCVVLLRPCSFKSTMIQMIGRGLRPMNGKRDCVVLDFGASLLTHGDIDAEVDLHGRDGSDDAEPGEAPVKVCPEESNTTTPYVLPDHEGRFGCGAEVPAGVVNCPFCGFRFERIGAEDGDADAITLTEIDLLDRSPFRWVDLFGTGKVLIASGFGTFSVVASPNGDDWFAIGKQREARVMQKITVAGKAQAVAAADDFLRENEQSSAANKARRWMTDPATPKQAELLARLGYEIDRDPFGGGAQNFTKLTATAHLNFQWNRRQVEYLLGVSA